MNTFEGKTIILGVPKLFNLDGMIEAELKAVGLKTINISTHTNTFQYRNLFERIESLIGKKIFRNRNYKAHLNFKRSKERIISELEKIDQADYILIIRPEVYPLDFLSALKQKGKKMIGYQWNGLKRQPQTIKYIGLFDRFFIFDARDLAVPGVFPTTNFYPTTIRNENSVEKTDIFYTGSFYRRRILTLNDVISKCEELGLSVYYHLFSRRNKFVAGNNLTVTKSTINYEEYIQYAYNTKILLDLKIEEHDGLSFRVLESVGFDKKLITTNNSVRNYDFYHPNNILIWTGQTKEELKDFINKPYVVIPKIVKQKYSASNWIHYVLDTGSYTPIELPQGN